MRSDRPRGDPILECEVGVERKSKADLKPAKHLRMWALACACLPALTACQSDILPAVFGLGNGGISAYAPGKLPAVAAHEGDKLIGQSASETGRCIYENAAQRRFRADCPPGYKP